MLCINLRRLNYCCYSVHKQSHSLEYSVVISHWGGCNPKKTEKNRKKPKKTSPKFEICGSVRFFSVFFGFFRFFSVFFGIFRFFSVFCGTFSVFFGLNFDKKFQSFKNHVNNEVLGGQELPNNILNAYKALQMSYKSYY